MLIFDGDCSACARLSRWAAAHFRRPVTVVAWQSLPADTIPGGLTPAQLADAVGWVDEEGRGTLAEVAAAKAMVACGGLWALAGRVILAPPARWVAPAVYRLVARNRHRLPGGTAACALPGDDRPAP